MLDGQKGGALATPVPAQHPPWGNQHAWYAYLRNLLATRPVKRRTPGLNGFAARLGIGEIAAGDPAFVYYADEHFVLAQQLLDGHPITVSAVASPTKIEAKHEAKRAKLAACGDDLVAVTLVGEAVRDGVHFFAMTCEGAERLQHDVVVVCQHIHGLRLLSSYEWFRAYLKDRKGIAIFRGGGGGDFGRLACERVLGSSTAPVLALFDCDPVGLAASLKLPRLEALCLPPTDELARQLAAGRPRDLFARQLHAHGATLDDCEHPQVAEAWQLVRRYGSGIPQSAFEGHREFDPAQS
jgi:hypothetical protein